MAVEIPYGADADAAWWQLGRRTRLEVLELAQVQQGYPNPEVAAIAVGWARVQINDPKAGLDPTSGWMKVQRRKRELKTMERVNLAVLESGMPETVEEHGFADAPAPNVQPQSAGYDFSAGYGLSGSYGFGGGSSAVGTDRPEGGGGRRFGFFRR